MALRMPFHVRRTCLLTHVPTIHIPPKCLQVSQIVRKAIMLSWYPFTAQISALLPAAKVSFTKFGERYCADDRQFFGHQQRMYKKYTGAPSVGPMSRCFPGLACSDKCPRAGCSMQCGEEHLPHCRCLALCSRFLAVKITYGYCMSSVVSLAASSLA